MYIVWNQEGVWMSEISRLEKLNIISKYNIRVYAYIVIRVLRVFYYMLFSKPCDGHSVMIYLAYPYGFHHMTATRLAHISIR